MISVNDNFPPDVETIGEHLTQHLDVENFVEEQEEDLQRFWNWE